MIRGVPDCGSTCSMDSQVTLVDSHGPVPPEENIILVFDRDDMRNTTLRIRGSYSPCYSVHTLGNATTVYAGGCLLATITRRNFRRDQITFPGLKPMYLGRWLKPPMLSPFPLVFHAHGQQFEWRNNVLKQLVLCESSRPDDVVAWFSQSRRDPMDQVMRAGYLTIRPQMDEISDLIVLSCILAEDTLVRVISAEERKLATYTAAMF